MGRVRFQNHWFSVSVKVYTEDLINWALDMMKNHRREKKLFHSIRQGYFISYKTSLHFYLSFIVVQTYNYLVARKHK